MGFPVGSDGKESCLKCGIPGFNPCVGKISWRRAWQPTPVFLPGEFHGQRSLMGYSPWFCKEPDMTERLSTRDKYTNIYKYEKDTVTSIKASILQQYHPDTIP